MFGAPLPTPPHLSACKICWRAEEVRRPPWKNGICCECFEHPSRDFKGRRVYCDVCICNSDANQNISRTTGELLSGWFYSISPASTPTPSAPVSRSVPHRAPHICQTTATQLSIWLQVATPEAPHFRSS